MEGRHGVKTINIVLPKTFVFVSEQTDIARILFQDLPQPDVDGVILNVFLRLLVELPCVPQSRYTMFLAAHYQLPLQHLLGRCQLDSKYVVRSRAEAFSRRHRNQSATRKDVRAISLRRAMRLSDLDTSRSWKSFTGVERYIRFIDSILQPEREPE